MPGAGSTCWTVIRGAAQGREGERTQFVAVYSPVIRAYLLVRWRGGPLTQNVDDAVQEVFLSCFREGGVLARADYDQPGGFRPFLYGVVRNVARQIEKRRKRRRERRLDTAIAEAVTPPDEASLERVFDRAWAEAIMREAADGQRRAAEASGPEAVRRVELLRMRFEEGLPIREIAAKWEEDAAHLHREYAKARREFEAALLDVMLFNNPGSRAREEARNLLALLGT